MMRLTGFLISVIVACACGSPVTVESAAPTDADASPSPVPPTLAPASTPSPTSAPTPGVIAPTPAATTVPSPDPPPAGIRGCDYDPLLSVPAVMPPEVTDRETDPIEIVQPDNTPVDEATTDDQLETFRALVDVITDDYVYVDLEGLNFAALEQRYETLIDGGLTDEDFYRAMDNFVFELGDQHSDFEDPAEVIASEEETSGNADFVGVGVLLRSIPDTDRAVVILTYRGGSAGEGGVKAHDAVLAVGGEPILDQEGNIEIEKVRGPEGTEVTLTVQTPGEAARDVTLERRRISSATPIDFCMVPRTTVGYVFLPTLLDRSIPRQMREAMQALTDSGPLDGLILDNRQNGGGFGNVLEEVLALFTDGTLGAFVSRQDQRPLDVEAEAIGNSQTVPMVVLVDLNTVSFGEVMSGVLQNSGRAQVVGQTTRGNVETLFGYDFDDGSRAWLASEAFEPEGQDLGVWEETGIVPDVDAPTRWDLFSEATDPAFPVALDLLADQGVPIPDFLTP